LDENENLKERKLIIHILKVAGLCNQCWEEPGYQQSMGVKIESSFSIPRDFILVCLVSFGSIILMVLGVQRWRKRG